MKTKAAIVTVTFNGMLLTVLWSVFERMTKSKFDV